MTTPSAGTLQRIAATGWGYGERAFLGEWELRAGGGFTTRANSTWTLGDPGRPLGAALEAVAEWYGARGLTPRVQTVTGSALDQRIAELGFAGEDSAALRQTAPLAGAQAFLKDTTAPDRVAEVTSALPGDYFELYRRALGHPDAPSVLTSGGAELRFAVVRDADGTPLAGGRLALDCASGWAGLSAIATAEAARRQGLARVVLRELVAIASEAGAHSLYLEVDPGNAAALPLYGSLGFTTHHTYHCRRPAFPA